MQRSHASAAGTEALDFFGSDLNFTKQLLSLKRQNQQQPIHSRGLITKAQNSQACHTGMKPLILNVLVYQQQQFDYTKTSA